MIHATPRRRRLRCALVILTVFATACSSSGTDTAEDSGSADAVAETATSEAVPETTTATAAPTTVAPTTDAPEETTSTTDTVELVGFDAVTAAVDTFVTDRGLSGAGLIIVEKDAGVLYEEHFGEFTPDRISMIASSSKMISAGVLLKLQEDGLLDIDAPVEGQVDWATGNPDITPAQLVSNSSGLVGLGPNLLYSPYLCQWGVPNTLQECGEAVFSGTGDDLDQVPPDTEFRYGGAQWQVAGAIAETVSGKSWDQLIDEIYVQPCGVDSLGYVSLGAVLDGTPGYPTAFGGDPDGVTESANPNIEGGAHITTRDYGTLLLMHLRGGMCGDTQVLQQESLDIMHTDRITSYGGNAGPDTGYGMGWWVDLTTDRISDGGAWGALPWLDLDDGYGAYIIIEDSSATGQALKQEIEELVHAAVTDAT